MRKMWIGLALALLAAGCGGTAPDGDGAKPQATRTLRQSCPLLEQAAPRAMFPSPDRLGTFSVRLDEIARQGDLETRQAVKILRKPTNELMSADPGQESVAASQDWIAAIASVKDRCAAVGSGAFQ